MRQRIKCELLLKFLHHKHLHLTQLLYNGAYTAIAERICGSKCLHIRNMSHKSYPTCKLRDEQLIVALRLEFGLERLNLKAQRILTISI